MDDPNIRPRPILGQIEALDPVADQLLRKEAAGSPEDQQLRRIADSLERIVAIMESRS